MESYEPEIKKENTIDIIYFLNKNKEQQGQMEIEKINNENKNIITYEEIKFSFEQFLIKKMNKLEKSEVVSEEELFDINDINNNIIYHYIGYSEGNGYLNLEENGIIFLDENLKLDNLKIKIKATILTKDKINIQNKMEKIKIEIDNIKMKLEDIKHNDINYFQFNSIILVANPLKDDRGKELRTVNDFNIIPATLYNLFNDEDYLKYTEFGILTEESFKKAIKKEFFIIHLICKSTYIYEEKKYAGDNKKNSSDFVNLIFEKTNNYIGDFINKERLDKIFSDTEIKENIKKIILIISTPLSEDVYNIFNNYGFKNILIQHTTPADVNFVAEFNLRFYENLILNRFKNFKNIYNDALNIFVDEYKNTFCCCFHKHKLECNFFKNLQNELYNNKDLIKDIDINKLKIAIPHFCHLKPECPILAYPCSNFNEFCVHVINCIQKLRFIDSNSDNLPIIYKKGRLANRGYSTCCCYNKKEKSEFNDIQHDINNIFKTNFSDENIEKCKARIILENNYIPKYEKMSFFVGKNEEIFQVLNALNSENIKNIYIYGDKIENLQLFINNVIEYHKERYYLFNSDKKERKEIEHIIILNEENSSNYKGIIQYKFYYYIYINDIKFIEFIKNNFTSNYKIIWFSEHELKNDDINYNNFETKIKINPEVSEPKMENEYIPNYYIKFQDKYSTRNILKLKSS